MTPKHPPSLLQTLSREVQALCRRGGRTFRNLTHRPKNPWQRFPYIDPDAHIGTLKWGKQYRPLRLKCETVNACNNLCIICSYPLDLRKKEIMSLDLFEKVLADYSALGGGYLTLTPVTGDILLDKFLLERLELVKKYPAITGIGVTTNAAMLHRFSDAEVRTIVQSFGKLQISVYGLDE